MIKNNLVIIENFFDKKEFDFLCNHLVTLPLSPVGNDKGNKYGHGYKFNEEKVNEWLFKKIKNVFFPDNNLKAVDCSFRLRHNKEETLVHIDDFADYNFMCFLKGKELMYNGTGFYNSNNQLDRYVGFKENIAMFFNGKEMYHSDFQALGESSPRYTLNIFYNHE